MKTSKIFFIITILILTNQIFGLQQNNILKKINKLKDPVIVEYYYTENMLEHGQTKSIVNNTMNTLKSISKKNKKIKLNIIKIKSGRDEDTIKYLEKLGIKYNLLYISINDKPEKPMPILSAIIIKYKNDTKIIPNIFDNEIPGQIIIKQIAVITKIINYKIGIFNTSNDPASFTNIYKLLESGLFDTVHIKSGEIINDDIEVLFIIGGHTISEYDLFQIDQYLMNGGKIIAALNGIEIIIDTIELKTAENNSKLIKLLTYYGLTINNDLVGDNDSYFPYMTMENMYLIGNRYPLWVKAINFNKNYSFFKDMDNIIFFWPSSITVDESISDYTNELITTTDGGWIIKDTFNLYVDHYKYPLQESTGKYNLACYFNGKLTSYYTENKIPESVNDKKIKQKGKAEIILISNDMLFKDQLIQANSDNLNQLNFLLNSIDYLISKDLF